MGARGCSGAVEDKYNKTRATEGEQIKDWCEFQGSGFNLVARIIEDAIQLKLVVGLCNSRVGERVGEKRKVLI